MKTVFNRKWKDASLVGRKNEADDAGEFLLYGVIGEDWFGDGISGRAFAEAITAMGNVKTIRTRIDSPGGSAFTGQAMYNTLVQHPARKIMVIEGLCASAASFFAMAGDEIEMSEISLFMMHRAMVGMIIVGNRMDLEKTLTKEIEVLDKLDQTIAKTYAARAGKEVPFFLDLMTAETWMTAEEAKGHGLVTSILPAKTGEPAACVGPDCKIVQAFRNMPETAKKFFNLSSKPAESGKETPVTTPKKTACGCATNEAEKKNATCPTCEGSGKVDGADCEKCGGTGQVPDEPANTDTNPKNAWSCYCDACGANWDAESEPGKCIECGSATRFECMEFDAKASEEDKVNSLLREVEFDEVQSVLAEVVEDEMAGV